jgi:hypothetical protein
VTPTPPNSTEQSILVKTLDRKHSDWLMFHSMYDEINLLYEGGVALKAAGASFLVKRPKELHDVYSERMRRLTYQNLLGNCIGWYIAKLFAREPRIDGKTTDARFASFLQDCDKAGTTFVNFSRSIFETMALYRRAFVLIDKPVPGDEVVTRADEQLAGLDRPYLIAYDPRQAFNWAVDAYGNLKWIIFKTLDEVQDDPTGPIKRAANWWLFDRTTFRHYQYVAPEGPVDAIPFFQNSDFTKDTTARATLVDEGPHSLASENRVPVRVCQLPVNLWFTNRAYLHLLEHFDQKNAYAWKLFMCAFPQLVIQTEEEIKGQTLSEVGYLKLKPADKVFWLEPDGSSLRESASHTDGLREEIYRDFNLQAQGKSSSASASENSGYSKEMDMAPSVDMLNALGDVLRADMQLILLDYATAAGLPVDTDAQKPDVDGFRFETKSPLQDIVIAQALMDTGVTDKSPTLEKLVDVNMAIGACDGQNEETKTLVTNEIKKAPLRKEQAAADLAAQQVTQVNAFQQQLNKTLTRSGTKDVAKQEDDSVAA